RISEEIYGYPAPFPMVYEWIHLKGVGAMHSSTGIVVTIQEMLDVVPPEVLRYLIIRNKPEKHIEFDPALPLLSLVDEYDQRKGDERAIELSNISKSGPFEIPFRHMVTAVQIARGDETGLFEALKRSGYDVLTRRDEIIGRARNVQKWLDRYAPAEQVDEKSAAEIHDLVYAVAAEQGLDSKKFFQAIYLAFLGDRQGPKVGWFLSSLERNFVKARLKEAASA
ncbi:MAG: lysine--tRNA ligase, partial [Methanothrix sp.]|nr:lysine--tRNA ligase [Methanothrix sp.]